MPTAAVQRLSALLAAVLVLPLLLAAALTVGAASVMADAHPATPHMAAASNADAGSHTPAESSHSTHQDAEPRCPDESPTTSCHSADESSPASPGAAPRPDSDSLWGTQRFADGSAGTGDHGLAARAPDLIALSISRT